MYTYKLMKCVLTCLFGACTVSGLGQGIGTTVSLKILGVTISNKLSVSEHVQQTLSRCAQSFHALGIIGNHGMEVNVLQLVFKSVLFGKMTYAVSA